MFEFVLYGFTGFRFSVVFCALTSYIFITSWRERRSLVARSTEHEQHGKALD